MTHYDAVCICDARMSWMRFDMEVSSFSHISFNAGVDKTWHAGDGAKTTREIGPSWDVPMAKMDENGGHVCLSHKLSHESKCGRATFKHSMVIFTGSMIHWTSVNSLVFFWKEACVWVQVRIEDHRSRRMSGNHPDFENLYHTQICCHQSTTIIHNQKTAGSPSVPCEFLPC